MGKANIKLALICFAGAFIMGLSLLLIPLLWGALDGGTFHSKYNSYQEACKALDFDAAHDILSVYRDQYAEARAKDDISGREERESAQEKYFNAFDYVYKAETQHILSEMEGEERKSKIIFMLEGIPVEGEKYPEGLCDYEVARRGDWGEEGIPLDAYIIWVQHYNQLCSNIMTLAISKKDQELAKAILLQFADNVEAITSGSGGKSSGRFIDVDGVRVDGYHGYIKYTSADRDAAQKKYERAVEMGAFN